MLSDISVTSSSTVFGGNPHRHLFWDQRMTNLEPLALLFWISGAKIASRVKLLTLRSEVRRSVDWAIPRRLTPINTLRYFI